MEKIEIFLKPYFISVIEELPENIETIINDRLASDFMQVKDIFEFMPSEIEENEEYVYWDVVSYIYDQNDKIIKIQIKKHNGEPVYNLDEMDNVIIDTLGERLGTWVNNTILTQYEVEDMELIWPYFSSAEYISEIEIGLSLIQINFISNQKN